MDDFDKRLAAFFIDNYRSSYVNAYISTYFKAIRNHPDFYECKFHEDFFSNGSFILIGNNKKFIGKMHFGEFGTSTRYYKVDGEASLT